MNNRPLPSGARANVRPALVLTLAVSLLTMFASPVQAGWLTSTWPTYGAAPDSEAARVLEIAHAQVGKPWQFAAVGPAAFDCSGLVWYAFKNAGLADRIGGKRRGATGYLNWFRTYGQISANLADARPGDILIWGGGKHAGLYISDNWAVSSLNARYGIRIHRADPIGLPFTAVLLVNMSRASDGTPSPIPDPGQQPKPTGTTPTPTPSAAGPLPPTNVSASAQPNLQVALSWNAGSAGAPPVKYRVYRNGYYLGGTSSPSYLDALWLPGVYRYQIQTVDANGLRSLRSVGAWVTSYVDGTPTDVTDTTPPSTPTGLVAQSLGNLQVALGWQPSTDSGPTAVGYVVMRGTKPVARVATPYYVDQPARPGTYSYSVFAYDGYGNYVRSAHVDGAASQ